MISPKGTRQKSGRKLAIRPAPSTLDLNLFVCYIEVPDDRRLRLSLNKAYASARKAGKLHRNEILWESKRVLLLSP